LCAQGTGDTSFPEIHLDAQTRYHGRFSSNPGSDQPEEKRIARVTSPACRAVSPLHHRFDETRSRSRRNSSRGTADHGLARPSRVSCCMCHHGHYKTDFGTRVHRPSVVVRCTVRTGRHRRTVASSSATGPPVEVRPRGPTRIECNGSRWTNPYVRKVRTSLGFFPPSCDPRPWHCKPQNRKVDQGYNAIATFSCDTRGRLGYGEK
jgi:hypothetical protein